MGIQGKLCVHLGRLLAVLAATQPARKSAGDVYMQTEVGDSPCVADTRAARTRGTRAAGTSLKKGPLAHGQRSPGCKGNTALSAEGGEVSTDPVHYVTRHLGNRGTSDQLEGGATTRHTGRHDRRPSKYFTSRQIASRRTVMSAPLGAQSGETTLQQGSIYCPREQAPHIEHTVFE